MTLPRTPSLTASAPSISAQFLYSRPQKEIASILSGKFANCVSASVVAGFLTPDGLDSVALHNPGHAAKISRFIVGAGTYQAFEAVDKLIAAGTSGTGVRIHLGHSRASGGRRNPFSRYHPMLHSKVYLFEMPNGLASAFVGSHNMTGFALRGLNGEAGVLLEGPAAASAFADVREHIDRSFSQAVPYDSTMKEAYAWWTREYFDGLRAEANDWPREFDNKRTIVILTSYTKGARPKVGEIVYFEIAEALSEIRSLDTDVHIHLFDNLPLSPSVALSQLHTASVSLSCRTEGLEVGQGGVELSADWSIEDQKHPELKATVRPFRPATSPRMQQVRVRVAGALSDRFDYLFDAGTQTWQPVFDQERLRDEGTGQMWTRVAGLSEANPRLLERPALRMALLESSPESGSFVLFSQRRKRRRADPPLLEG